MNTNDPEEWRAHIQLLRRRAEEALRGNSVDLDGLHKDDIQYLLHELQVHQAELQIQNEDLRRVQLELEASRDLYSDLYNLAPSGYCTLSKKGRILNANLTLAEMLGIGQEKLLQRSLSDFVDRAYQDEFYLHCQRVYKKHGREESEIQLAKPDGERVVVRIESMMARGDPTLLMMMLSNITEKRRLEEKQQGFIARMELQRRLMEQSEKERGELARNLHDGPLQNLTGLGFSLQIIKENLKDQGVDGGEDIEQLGEEIKKLAVELRGICNNLRPPVLSRFGLRRALQENVEEFQTKHPHTKITLDFPDDPTLLPEHVALALYRIYQQALSNIIRHTAASDVWVRMKFDLQQLIFEIQDNGQGFASSVDWQEYITKGHFGLVGMQERAEAIGGAFELISKPGEGTLIRVIVRMNDCKE